jgi:hypothetical protein
MNFQKSMVEPLQKGTLGIVPALQTERILLLFVLKTKPSVCILYAFNALPFSTNIQQSG